MNKELQLVVATVAQERTVRLDKSFAMVAELADRYPLEELADRLVTDIPSTVPSEVLAEMLNILMWSTSDNGASIRRSAERWLVDANDVWRIQIALGLETYPFKTKEAMRRVFADVAHRFPEVAQRCNIMADERARSPE